MIRGGSWLVAGGVLSLVAALAHLACIVGGPQYCRFMGAGERIARMAEAGKPGPAIITVGIASALAAAAAFAFSGAGAIGRLPLLRTALVVITAIYLARGIVLLRPSLLARPDLSPAFLLWSSLIVLALGVIHAIGTWQAWPTLSQGT